MIQWTRQAKEYFEKLDDDITEDIQNKILLTHEEINRKRVLHGLKPKSRITKDVVKQTIINLTEDTFTGDAKRKEKELDDFGGMYQ